MNGLVSIVVPVYNMGDSIEVCVRSLLSQDYQNIEIVLVDDGSRDNSYEVCLSLKKEDSRVKVYHTENRGSGPARNYGIEKANGRYICFPDADDIYSKDAVSNMVEGMKNGECDFVVAGYESILPDGKVQVRKIYPDEIHSGDYVREHYDEFMNISQPCAVNGAPWNKLYDMEIIRKYDVTYPPLRRHQDTGFIHRYLCYVKNVNFISSVVYTHHLNDLRKEWYKYPVDYIECVTGLKKVAEETVLTWNPDNKKTVAKINQGHISKTIKAMELTFSPKVKYTTKKRVGKVCEIMEKSEIANIEIPDFLGKYQKKICKLLFEGKFKTAICMMHFKILVEKNGILLWLKNI